jgi:hypothetical protein
MNGQRIVTKKPLGKIKLVADHVMFNGIKYYTGHVFDYYAVLVNSECSQCGKQGVKKTYKVSSGNIPFEKAVLL